MGQDGHVSAVSQTSERVVAILEAACRVVVREGAHGLRMAAVAREAGVSKALVHYYFATRQELVRSAFSWSEEQWQSALRERIRSAPDAAARIEQALLLTLDPAEPFAEHRALWNEVWSSLRFDDELRPLVDSSYRKWIQRLTILVRGARAEGSAQLEGDPRDTAWRLAALADGIDSMLYLELLGRERARTLLLDGIRRELGA
jgi:AcrR family transcriptional regulator